MAIMSGINTLLSSLMAHQQALDLTGQNIANVNTPGYHRQEVVLGARVGRADGGNGTILGGVDVLQVRRANTSYLDLQLRLINSQYGEATATGQQLSAVEGVLFPPGAKTLNGVLDEFWNSWQSLAAAPDQVAPRLTVQRAGSELAAWMNDRYQQLTALRSSAYETIKAGVTELNALATQVADLNARIARSGAGGTPAGELIDQRQQALERLAELGGVVAFRPEADGTIITLNGHPLVQGGQAFAVSVGLAADGAVALQWADTGQTIEPEGGELAGLIAVRDKLIPDYLNTLDQIASQIITTVNAEHVNGAGMNGEVGAFFAGAGAADMRLADAIAASPTAIAAGAAGLPGDGSIAAAVSALREQPLIGTQTVGQAASGLAARIGEEMVAANQRASTADSIRQQMIVQQQSVGGVSLDEEMTRMMEYQRAYSAAARVMVTMDEMVNDLLQIIG